MVDRIDSFVAREGVEGDKEFFLKALNEIYERFQKVSSLKLELNGAKTLSSAGDAVARARKEMEELQKAVQKLSAQKKAPLVEKSDLDAFAELNRQYKEAERNAKNLGAIKGIDSEEFRKAAAAAQELKEKLDAINQAAKGKAPVPVVPDIPAAPAISGPAADELKKVEVEFSQAKVLAKNLTDLFGETSEQATNAMKRVEELQAKINDLKSPPPVQVEVDTNLDTTVNAFEALKQQYKQAKADAEDLAARFGVQDEKAQEAARSAAELKTRIDDINKSIKEGGQQPTLDVPFTTNLDELEKERDLLNSVGDAVSDYDRQQADAVMSANEWAAAQQVVEEESQKVADGLDRIKTPFESYTGTLQENLLQQKEYKDRISEISNELKTLDKTYTDAEKTTSLYKSQVAALLQEQSELKNASTELGHTIKAQVKYIQAMDGSYDQLNAELGISRNLFRQLTDEEKSSQFGEELLKRITKLDEVLKSQDASIGNFQRNVGNYQGSARIIVDALTKVEEKIATLKEKQEELSKVNVNQSGAGKIGFVSNDERMKQLNQVTAELKHAEKEFEALNTITSDPKFFNLAKVGDARTEIRGFTAQLVQLEQQGLGKSDFADELRQRLAELTDQVGDTRDEIKALASDTRSFDQVASSVAFLANSYQTLVGAQALFGDTTEETEETLKKLMAVQAFANGLQEVSNTLTTRGTLVNKAYAWVQGLVAIATDASATATARLAAATKLLGIGLLVGAIAYIAIKYQEWAKAASEAGRNQKLLNDIASKAADSYGAEKAKLDVLVASIKQEGKSRKEKFETLKELQSAYPGYFDNIKTEADLNNKLADAYERASKGILLKASANAAEGLLSENISKGLKARVEFEKKERELALQDAQDLQLSNDPKYRQQLREQQQKAAKSRSESLGNDLTSIDKENKFLLQQILDYNRQIESLGGTKKGADTTAEKDSDNARKALFELEKQRLLEEIRLRKEAAESYVAGLSNRIASRQAAFDKEIELAKLERDFTIVTAEKERDAAVKNTKLSSKERADIIRASEINILTAQEGYAIKEKELEKQTASDIIAIRAKIAADARQQREQDLSYAKGLQGQTLQAEISRAQVAFEKRVQLIESQADEEQQINLRTYEKGRISKEEYEQNKADIETKYRRASLLAEIEYNEKLLQLVDLSPEKKAEAEKKLYDLKKQLREQDLKDEEEGYNRSVELAKKRNEKLADLGNELKELTYTIISAGIERQQESIQEQIDLLEKKKEKDIEVVTQTVTNQAQAADQIAVINARAEAQKEQLERRKRALDEQRARFERLRNIADIIQSTSVAVVSALGAKPWTPANIALAAIVGAIGAAQIARVLATPIPKFFRGKDKHNKYEGPAIVDDGGKPEAILREDGSVEIGTNQPRLTYLGRNDIVLPDARDLADQQFHMAINATGKLVQGYQPQAHVSDNRDLEKAIHGMRKDVVHAIKNIPQPNIKTTSPIENWLRSGTSWQNFIGGRR